MLTSLMIIICVYRFKNRFPLSCKYDGNLHKTNATVVAVLFTKVSWLPFLQCCHYWNNLMVIYYLFQAEMQFQPCRSAGKFIHLWIHVWICIRPAELPAEKVLLWEPTHRQRGRGRQQEIFPNTLKKDAGTDDMYGRSWRLEDLYKGLTAAALLSATDAVASLMCNKEKTKLESYKEEEKSVRANLSKTYLVPA